MENKLIQIDGCVEENGRKKTDFLESVRSESRILDSISFRRSNSFLDTLVLFFPLVEFCSCSNKLDLCASLWCLTQFLHPRSFPLTKQDYFHAILSILHTRL